MDPVESELIALGYDDVFIEEYREMVAYPGIRTEVVKMVQFMLPNLYGLDKLDDFGIDERGERIMFHWYRYGLFVDLLDVEYLISYGEEDTKRTPYTEYDLRGEYDLEGGLFDRILEFLERAQKDK